MIKGKVLYNTILVSLDMIEEKNGVIMPSNSNINGKEGVLSDTQTVEAKGPNVQEIEVGDRVMVNFSSYLKPVKKRPQEGFGVDREDYELQLPIIEINGEKYGRITERDVIYVFDESEIAEVKA